MSNSRQIRHGLHLLLALLCGGLVHAVEPVPDGDNRPLVTEECDGFEINKVIVEKDGPCQVPYHVLIFWSCDVNGAWYPKAWRNIDVTGFPMAQNDGSLLAAWDDGQCVRAVKAPWLLMTWTNYDREAACRGNRWWVGLKEP